MMRVLLFTFILPCWAFANDTDRSVVALNASDDVGKLNRQTLTVGAWPPCSSTSRACCNPHLKNPPQFCPGGGGQCQECGGGVACECPSQHQPTPLPTPAGPTPHTPRPTPVGPTPRPTPPLPANPLGITPLSRRSDNFFLIIGDWGKPDWANGGCQRKVAQMMKDYVAKK